MKRIAVFFLLALAAMFASAQGQGFRIVPDVGKGFPSYFIPAPSYVDARDLAASVAETHTVPSGANAVVFSASCALFYAKTGASVAVISADVTDGTASFPNPTQWFIGAATQLSLIAPTTCKVGLAWFTFNP